MVRQILRRRVHNSLFLQCVLAGVGTTLGILWFYTLTELCVNFERWHRQLDLGMWFTLTVGMLSVPLSLCLVFWEPCCEEVSSLCACGSSASPTSSHYSEEGRARPGRSRERPLDLTQHCYDTYIQVPSSHTYDTELP